MTNQVCIYKLHVIISGSIYTVRMLRNQFHVQMALCVAHIYSGALRTGTVRAMRNALN